MDGRGSNMNLKQIWRVNKKKNEFVFCLVGRILVSWPSAEAGQSALPSPLPPRALRPRLRQAAAAAWAPCPGDVGRVAIGGPCHVQPRLHQCGQPLYLTPCSFHPLSPSRSRTHRTELRHRRSPRLPELAVPATPPHLHTLHHAQSTTTGILSEAGKIN